MFLPDQYRALAAEMQEAAAEQYAERLSQGLSTEIRLLLVSKYQSKEDICQAFDYFSQNHLPYPNLGENYIQQAEKRVQELQQYPLKLELIGHLQSNKAEKALALFSTLHSIFSTKLVKVLANKKRAAEFGEKLQVFLQYNASREPQKNGCRSYDELCELLECILQHGEQFCVRGLMCMAAAGSNSRERRAVFRDCREQALRLWREFDGQGLLPRLELSMGMSQDYREALAEGASVLRIGSLLFSS